MDSMGLSILAWPCVSRLSFFLHSILKGMILDASNDGLHCFPFPFEGLILSLNEISLMALDCLKCLEIKGFAC